MTMNDSKIHNMTKNKLRIDPWLIALRAIDVMLFTVLIYFFVDAVSLYTIGIYSIVPVVVTFLLGVILLTLPLLAEKNTGWFTFVCCPLVFIAADGCVRYILTIPPEYSYRYGGLWGGWFPPEWHQAPLVWYSFFVSMPEYFIPLFLVAIALLYLQIRGSRYTLLSFNLILIITCISFTIHFDIDALRIMIMMLTPLFVAVISYFFKLCIMERRFAVLGIIFCAAAMNYVGMLPIFMHEPHFPGLERVYPPKGQKSALHLPHLRDVICDEDKGVLFASWGPTSGILRYNLISKEEIVREAYVSRFLHFSFDKDYIYGVGWLKTSYFEFSTGRLLPFRQVSLKPYRMGQLFFVERSGSDVYINCYEPNVLAQFDHDTFKLKALVNFRDSGYTKMSCGTARFIFSQDESRIYQSIGMTDVPMTFSILELDSKTLEVLHTIKVPELPLNIIHDSSNNRLLVSSFYSDKIFTINLHTYKVTDVHHGVIHARMFLYDRQRGWLITGSYYTGGLAILDINTFEKLITQRISRRIQSGHLYKKESRIYMATTEGIYRLDLDKVEKYLSTHSQMDSDN